MTSSITEKCYGANNGKCQNIHDSVRVWLVHLSSIKFFTGFYLYHVIIFKAFLKGLHQEN